MKLLPPAIEVKRRIGGAKVVQRESGSRCATERNSPEARAKLPSGPELIAML